MKLARPLAALLVVIVALVCVRLVAERAGAPERGRTGSDVSGGAEPRSDSSADVELAAQPRAAMRDVVTPADLAGTHLVIVDDTGAPVDDARVRWVTADSAATVGEGAALPSEGRYLVLVERDDLVPRADFVDAAGATRFVLQRGARIELRLVGDLPEWTRFEALLIRRQVTDAPRDDEYAYPDDAREHRERVERALDASARASKRLVAQAVLARADMERSIAVFETRCSTSGRSLVWATLAPGQYRYRVESPCIDPPGLQREYFVSPPRPLSAEITARPGDMLTFELSASPPARLSGKFVFTAPSHSEGEGDAVVEIQLSRGVERMWTELARTTSSDGSFDFVIDEPANHFVVGRLASSDVVHCSQVTALGVEPGEWRELGAIREEATTLRVTFAPRDVAGAALDPSAVFDDAEGALRVQVRTSQGAAPVAHLIPFDARRPLVIRGLPPARAFVSAVATSSSIVAKPYALTRRNSGLVLGDVHEIEIVDSVDVEIDAEFHRPGVDPALSFTAPKTKFTGSVLVEAFGTRIDGTRGLVTTHKERLATDGRCDVYGARVGSVLYVSASTDNLTEVLLPELAPRATLVIVDAGDVGGEPLALHPAGRFVFTASSATNENDSRFEFEAPGSGSWLELPVPIHITRPTRVTDVYSSQPWCLPLGWRVRSVDGKLAATLPSAVELGTEVVVELQPVE